jgi:hypothetical protein
MHVIFESVPSRRDWQAAITAAGFDLTLSPTLDTIKNTGYVPVRFDDLDSGFEFSVASVGDSVPTYLPSANASDRRKLSANFVWGGDLVEMCCAFAAASALAKLAGGVLFLAENGVQYSGDEAIEAAKAQIADVEGMY